MLRLAARCHRSVDVGDVGTGGCLATRGELAAHFGLYGQFVLIFQAAGCQRGVNVWQAIQADLCGKWRADSIPRHFLADSGWLKLQHLATGAYVFTATAMSAVTWRLVVEQHSKSILEQLDPPNL